MNILKRLILYPLGPRPISCSQAAKMGHAQRRAHIRSTARQIRAELGLPPDNRLAG